MTANTAGQRWAIARATRDRDPARYLGELRYLPAAEHRQPGDWCDVVVCEQLQGTMSTLMVVDYGHPAASA